MGSPETRWSIPAERSNADHDGDSTSARIDGRDHTAGTVRFIPWGENEQSMNGNDRAIAGFTMTAHFMFHLYELAIPLFIVVWLDVFAVSPAVLGTVVGAGYGLIGVGALVSGHLADAYGSKRLVLLATLGMGGSFLLISLAPTVWVLALALVVWGATASLYHPAGLSLLTRGARERGTALAYHGAAGSVGTAVGPFAAAVLLTFFEWRLVAALFTLPMVVALVIGYRFDFDETAAVDTDVNGGTEPPSLRGVLRDSRLLFVGGFTVAFAVMLLHGIYARGVFSFLPEILGQLPALAPVDVLGSSFEPSQYVYAGLLLAGAGGQYVGGKWSDRGSPELAIVVIYLGIVGLSLAFVPATNAGLVPLLVVCGLLGFATFMTAPIRQSLIATYAPADVHGLSFGYTYLGVFGFGAVGATLAGASLTYADTRFFFGAFAVFAVLTSLLGGLLYLRWGRHRSA